MPWIRALLMVGVGSFLIACQPPYLLHPLAWDSMPQPDQRTQLVRDAEELADARSFVIDGRSFPKDCSGFVGAVLLRNGIDVFQGAKELDLQGYGVQLLYEFVSRYGTLFLTSPKPGDLVFFSNTYDRNHDRKANDPLTHVGIVESVDPDGTVHFLHVLKGKTVRHELNLNLPSLRENDEGKIVNAYLRRSPRGRRSTRARLTGELFTAFGSIFTLTEEPLSSSRERTKEVGTHEGI